ncbi:hypothetical protein NIES2107_05760 [Nostoc carneum NIES-2107]|nr:hypothetical protein NIES2107_05760 [Nostoc carneum NIES-2107]
MVQSSKYWEFVKLDSTSKRRVEMIVAAQTYFQKEFAGKGDVSDAAIARYLWQQMQQDKAGATEEANLAEICLRCYVSQQIYRVCLDLTMKFGNRHGFTSEDLLPFVLDDQVIEATSDKPRVRKSTYESLATKLLKTFDPAKGSLNAWVSRYVKQNAEIKRFLLQHGVFLISDWALLNDTNPKELQRILADMYHLTPMEIEQVCQLLISYHAVYREDRLQQKLAGVNLPCQIPTAEQLTRMINDLQSRTNRKLSQEAMLNQLQAMASKLRQYRIAAQGGYVASVAYDQPEIQPIVERSLLTEEGDDKADFMNLYQEEFLTSLDAAISHVVEVALGKLQSKRNTSQEIKRLFMTGLHLFHCQGQPMSQIAPQLGMKKQYEVTRLLKLNELRADIRQSMLLILRDRVLQIAKDFTNVERLQLLDQQLELILDEQISGVMQEAESEVKNPVRNQPLSGLLARRLCLYLDNREEIG